MKISAALVQLIISASISILSAIQDSFGAAFSYKFETWMSGENFHSSHWSIDMEPHSCLICSKYCTVLCSYMIVVCFQLSGMCFYYFELCSVHSV